MAVGAPAMRVLELLFLLRCISVFVLIHAPVNGSPRGCDFECPAALFGLGDSLTDTGQLLRAFPSPALVLSGNSPYGRTFPGYPTGRYSDGKLMIDFIAEGLGLPLLDPYFKNIGANFNQGVNFAAAGSTARNTPAPVPFFLALQVDQAVYFHRTFLASIDRPPASVSRPFSFANRGLYSFKSGGNDIRVALVPGGATPVPVKLPIGAFKDVIGPEVVSNISSAITRLYEEIGARQFMVWGLAPMGCSPALLALLQTVREAGPIDDHGCLAGINALAQEVNLQLAAGVHGLRHNLPDALVIFVDFYDIALNITTHYGDYGFKEPLKACCGSSTGVYGYNYDPNVPCGMPGANFSVCENPAEYISWDGIHYTEAFYKLVAEAVLTGQILDPPIPIASVC